MPRFPSPPAAVTVLALAAVGLVGFALGGVSAWLGAAALLVLASRPAVLAAAGRLGPALPWSLLALLTVVLLRELVLGHVPASRDHGVHYFQTRILVDEMVAHGRLWGYSESFNNGYPYGHNYPVFGYLWAGALHLASFGAVPLRFSYAYGLLSMWIVTLVAITALVDRLVRELWPQTSVGTRAWAGCVAAALWLLDPGAAREGGWNYLLFHGVWPQQCSTALWLAGLAVGLRAAEAPTRRRLALAGLCLGASVLAHPFGVLATAVTATTWLVALLWARPAPTGSFRTWAAVHGLAVLACAGWWTVFVGAAEAMERSPVMGRSLAQIAADVVRGRFYGHDVPWLGPLAALGAVLAMRRGRLAALTLVVAVPAMLVCSSEAVFTVLELDLLSSGLKNLQYPRWAITIKPLLCVLAGAGVLAVVGAVTGLVRAPALTGRRWLVVGLAAPFVAMLAPELERLAPRPVGEIETLEVSGRAEQERALHDALRAEAEAHGPLKVAFLRKGMSAATFPLLSITDVGASVVLDGHVPGVNFRYTVDRRTPQALATLGVTHVIHDRKLPADDAALGRALESVARVGRFRLERLVAESAQGRPRAELFATQGTAEIVEDRPGSMIVDTAFEGAGRLRVVMAPYRSWTATLDGEPLEIKPVSWGSAAFTGSELPLPHAGRVVIEFSDPLTPRIVGWISLLAWVVASIAIADPRPTFTRPLAPIFGSRAVWIATLVAVGVLATMIPIRRARMLAESWVPRATRTMGVQPDEPAPVLLGDLVRDGAIEVLGAPARYCDAIIGRDALAGCIEADHRPRVAAIYADRQVHRCVDVSIPARKRLDVVLVRPDPAAYLVGFVQRRRGERDNEDVSWATGQSTAVDLPYGDRTLYAPPDGDSNVVLHLANRGPKIERVCVAAAAFTPGG